jgi:hypothetical protein
VAAPAFLLAFALSGSGAALTSVSALRRLSGGGSCTECLNKLSCASPISDI